MNMETIYSKIKFEGFTHKFIIELNTNKYPYSTRIEIYSNSDDNKNLMDLIWDNKPNELNALTIVGKYSKKECEMKEILSNELLKHVKII